MGLRDYKLYKKEQELKNSETIRSLQNQIDELKKEVYSLREELNKKQLPLPPHVFTKEEKEAIEKISEGKTKPEEFIKMFTSDLEEFNPNA